jgi:hypothetical protein
VLSAIGRVPLTAPQLLKLSATFEQPFGSERMVRERLQALGAAGWVRWSRYATISGGAAPKYFFLSPRGYRLLHGPEAVPPKRTCLPLPITRHRHTQALAEFLVHLTTAAHAQDIRLVNFYGENTLRLNVDGESLFPDSAFDLELPASALDPELPDSRQFHFLVEIDRSTERIWSPQDLDSWQRKVRLYDRLQDMNAPDRFRVLVVGTRSRQRVEHILGAAKELMRNPKRSLFYGITLAEFLATAYAATGPCFRDHFLQPVSLLAERRQATGTTAGLPRDENDE